MNEIRNLSVNDAVNTYQFSFQNTRMISKGRGIHPSWEGLIRLVSQFLLPRGYSSFFLYLVSHLPPSLEELLNPSLRSIFMFLKAFVTRLVERNLGNTLNHLWMTLRGTGRAVSRPASQQILHVGIYPLICWTSMPAGNVPIQRTDTLRALLNC